MTENGYELLTISLIFLPLLFGCLIFAASKHARNIALLATGVQVIVCFVSLLWLPQNAINVYIGSWQPPLGVRWQISGVSVVMATFCSLVFFLISLFARHQVTAAARQTFWPLMLSLQTGIIAVFFTRDLFNAYIVLEIVGLSAVGLVAISPGSKTSGAAFHYLSVNVIGSLCYLFAVALIYRTYGVLDFQLLQQVLAHGQIPTAAYISVAFITLGLTFKSALAPMHGWLPEVHGAALPVVSALLSGLVVKCSLYLLFTLWWTVFTPLISDALAWVISLGGATAIIVGALKACRINHLKQIAAYSTVGQIGYLFLFLPLSTNPVLDYNAVLSAFILFIIAHALAKVTLFLTVGYIKYTEGCVTSQSTAGLALRQPLLVCAFAIAAISLIGLPPSGGFTAKWALLSLYASVHAWWVFMIVIIGSVLSAAGFFKVLVVTMTAADNNEQPLASSDKPGATPLAIILLLSSLTIVAGFCFPWLSATLLRGS
ncbi:complex I subunit 5 family protein [Salinimonas chungwhensis]|uniref:complex I subunit 5 family protein n=1 Tax=Salinimonas chungwhensis TaxID=265425 RepID=UPI000360D1E4|nr:proton-conducting transporter membrane subunit [Salinimonas chungwhensis]